MTRGLRTAGTIPRGKMVVGSLSLLLLEIVFGGGRDGISLLKR